MKIAIQPKVHHKCHVEKIMFLSCVARPLFNADGSVKFDGLVKVVPVVQEYIAQRTKNQTKGDVTTKHDHVNSETYHNSFVNGGVFDAAEEKMPWQRKFIFRIHFTDQKSGRRGGGNFQKIGQILVKYSPSL